MEKQVADTEAVLKQNVAEMEKQVNHTLLACAITFGVSINDVDEGG